MISWAVFQLDKKTLIASLKSFRYINNILTSTYQHTFLVGFRSSMAPERHIAVLSQNTHTLIVRTCMCRLKTLHLFLSIFSIPVYSFSNSTFTTRRYCLFSHKRIVSIWSFSRACIDEHNDRSQRFFFFSSFLTNRITRQQNKWPIGG
jgi:hypothetical protein